MVIVNYLMPCLIFNKVLSSLDSSDLQTIGVLLLTAVLYQLVGFFFSLTVKATTPNPKYWVGGLLIAGIFTNSGDLPIAYITTLSGGSPFTADDGNKGIAYCVLFLAVFIFSMFNLGMFRMVQRDFIVKGNDIEKGVYDPDVDSPPGLLPLFQTLKSHLVIAWGQLTKKQQKEAQPSTAARGGSGDNLTSEQPLQPQQQQQQQQSQDTKTSTLIVDVESPVSETHKNYEEPTPLELSGAGLSLGLTQVATNSSYVSNRSNTARLKPITSHLAKKTVLGLGTLNSDSDEESEELDLQPSENINDVIDAYAPTPRLRQTGSCIDELEEVTSTNTPDMVINDKDAGVLEKITTNGSKATLKHGKWKQRVHNFEVKFNHFIHKYHLTMLWELIKNFKQTPSAALIVSIVFTMVPPIRHAFYIPPELKSSGTIHEAPDEGPILGFVMDFTSFVGNATVPIGLSLLGATMARLKIGKLPDGFWKSILLMAVFKLIVLPIIAIAWTEKMKQLNWISPDNHMAMFVMIVSSGVPTATSQVYLTAIYMPKGGDIKEMDCLAAYLICQYILLVFSMTILLTYTLKNVLGL